MQTTTSPDRPTTLCEDWARFSRAMDSVPDIVVIVGADRRIRYVNPAAVEASAYSASYLLGRLPEEAWGNRIAEAYRRPVDTCFRTGEVTKSEAEIHFASKDFYVQISCVPLAGREGSVREVMCVTQDLTDAKRAAEALERSEGHLAAAQQIARLGSWEIDLASSTAHWSSEMYRLYGRDQSLGAPTVDEFLAYVHPDDVHLLTQAAQEVITTGARANVEYRTNPARGAVRWLQATYAVGSRSPQGALRQLIGAVQDVTERRAAEEERVRLWAELQEAQRLESLGGLAGAVAHDFNNMLAVVLGYANLLQDALPVGSPLNSLVACIEDTGRQAAELTRQLMLYSGHATRPVQPIDLSKLVGGLDRLLDTIVSKRAQLDLALASDLPEIAADDVQVRQVVVNLVSNAADSMLDAAGTVTVSTGVQVIASGEAIPGHVRGDCSPGTYVYLEVVDEGSGIAEPGVSRIFEPFFTTKSTGHGLGLPATLGIVRGHGGAIVLETECGTGTKVRALFPTA